MTKLGGREIPSQPVRFAGPATTGSEHEDKVVTGVLFRRPDPTSDQINCEVYLEGEREPVLAFFYIRLTMTFGDELVGQTFGAIRRQFRERDIALVVRTTVPSYSFTLVTTAMPVQAVGRIADGRSYYFWARYGRWTVQIGQPEWPNDPVAWPIGAFTAAPDASGSDDTNGHMTEGQVRAILDRVLGGPNYA